MNASARPGSVVLLHGAIKNAGDFLITRRARAILEDVWPTVSVREVDRRAPLESEGLDPDDVVVLGGGPGLARDAYPNIYNISGEVLDQGRLIVPMGLGWAGQGDAVSFTFDPATIRFLDHIQRLGVGIGVRDELTLEILDRSGYAQATLSGCPAWYDLNHFEQDLREPSTVRRILISNPARPPHFLEAARLIEALRKTFGDVEITIVFHRGVGPDKNTPVLRGVLDAMLARWAEIRGLRVIDAAYSSNVLETYGEYDFHVGYRVHAHIAFLSQRRPSVLIEEDGRGRGQTRTLRTRGVDVDRSGVRDIVKAVRAELDSGFSGSKHGIEVMQRTFPAMRDLVGRLPLGA